MVASALDQMKAQGVRRAELQAEADNARGLAFYRKLGFEQEGVQRRAYRRSGDNEDVDEIMMVRFLDQPLAACSGGLGVTGGAKPIDL